MKKWKVVKLLELEKEECSQCRALKKWIFLERGNPAVGYIKCVRCSILESIRGSNRDYFDSHVENYYPAWDHYVKEKQDSLEIMSLDLSRGVKGIQRHRFTGTEREDILPYLNYRVPNLIKCYKIDFMTILKSKMMKKIKDEKITNENYR